MGDINETQGRIKEVRKATFKCLRHQVKQSTYVNWMPTICSAVRQAKPNEAGTLWSTFLQKQMMNTQWNYEWQYKTK